MEHNFDNLKIWYFRKILTSQQREFIEDLINSLIKNKKSLLEFPPTLDKDFLFSSTLYTLSHQKTKKFLIITSNSDKVAEFLKIVTKIAKLSKNQKRIKIIPFYERKLLCKEESALKDISLNGGNDYFCYKLTSSWVPENEKCSLFKVIIY